MKEIKTKINKYAFSGGQATVEEHKEKVIDKSLSQNNFSSNPTLNEASDALLDDVSGRNQFQSWLV